LTILWSKFVWTNSNNKFGKDCDAPVEFVKTFKVAAQRSKQGGSGELAFKNRYRGRELEAAVGVQSRQREQQALSAVGLCQRFPNLLPND
jgi:hypothetical protein